MSVVGMNISRLREAIQSHRMSFPSQVPIFECQYRADIQWRVVELYFIRGWSCSELGRRYGVNHSRIRQILRTWVQRAVLLGYLQEIPGASPVADLSVAAESEVLGSSTYASNASTSPVRVNALAAGASNA